MANDNVVMLRGKRPLSVWVAGIANGILAAFLIGTSLKAEAAGYSGGQAAIVGIAGLAIAVAAHATWYGYRTGRLVLLVMLTLILGLLLVQSLMTIAWANETGYQGRYVDAAALRALFSLAWLALNYIFVFRKNARSFFG